MSEDNFETIDETPEVQEENKEAEVKDEVVEEMLEEELDELLAEEKRKGRLQGLSISFLIFAILAVVIVLIVGKGGSRAKSKLIDDKAIDKADFIWRSIDKYYLWDEDIQADKAREAMYKGMVNSLGDQYSVYYTEEEFSELTEDYSGEYSGIGAYISQNQETMEAYISRPMPGSPAEEAGLVANDYIYEVDGENVVGQDLNLIVSKIKGPEGTTVDIAVKHNNKGELDVITVERRKIEVARIESEMLEDNIGYIWIYEFEQKTDTQFNKAYDQLKEQGMEGLIVDLRDNPGGDLDVVIRMCDKFLDGGMIVYTKTKNGKGDEYKADSECEKIPIVIITNENSASASEIFTGALKERGVAKVVGNTTFGKGIVQALFSLGDGSGLKVTESEYYLPNDECIHGVGITPDYEVDLDYEAYYKDKANDAQKQKAIEVMKGLLK